MSSTLIDLKLPQLTTEQPPQFTSLQTCKDWLAGVPITNATQAQAQLLRQINLLNHYTLATGERLKILEFLRTPIYFVHGECVKRFGIRPRPLAPPEQAAFDTSQALWQALETGYLHCLKDCLDNTASADEGSRDKAAFAATRALTSLLATYMDNCSAAILPAPAYWQRVHRVYLTAEKLQVAQLPVDDKLRHNPAISATATYVEILLFAAAYPLELRPRQISQVSYWAHRWSAKVPILRVPPSDTRTPPLCVDLAGEQTAEFQPAESSPVAAAETMRWLDLAELRKTVKQRLVKLAQGESPQDLKLGKDCVQPACELLLRQAYQDWCKGGRATGGRNGKNFQRGNATLQLVSSIDAIHYFISGQIFRPPDQSVYLSQREHEEIATFGRIATRFEEDKKLQHSYVIEDWQVLDENVGDLRLRRPLGQPGGRLACDQLVATRASENEGFQLGAVHWIFVAGVREALIAGVHILPGTPVAATLHLPASGAIKAQYCRGFCLPAIEGLGEVASVLTPEGWFRPDHIIDMQTDAMRKIRLTYLIERGTDFDRCAFEYI